MANHFPIKTLIGLAQDDVDAAAQRLGRAQRERNDVQSQLDALVQYRDEYHARFTATAQTGMPAGNMRNFQAFIDTLDAAIEQQRNLLVTANARVETAKPDWQRQKQKLGSYEVLRTRGEAAEAKTVARRDQRDSDEHAARILRMRAEGV
ncbi:Flagellar FliJ protein [Paraburkholderia domus]|jgi:flagellar export protein FliJ|uniref:Flagellar FliJ protein n=1 Tax=Paraburkholderia domus TaxID=2793075 RepID=A0A9N8QW93_9BURK|nr:flagellar export protein FliJ [Paraburkholderia domus]MBK5047549.1 flagellar export protein FliJ [Burkholderia sp. R-70006]MBK5062832.1 flagellar export protein FliJ [Burkholderia sp. R-70199]MBK5084965.1 flagellar export protein FliJ [Burkholderia sp. R-69927]MBK5119718.1 flagellar export protein FliJ [Burkholderia sp. R-69980]MBK5164039.1 flagellar export protein FliJ [Burkholderia sp. R-70211]MBK5178859.1 flagellar export protein FliJ [Burkholderia sp. R-69749]MCI0148574.1 flagellar ex